MKNWNDIYLLPLELAGYGCHVYDQRDNFVFQFQIRNEKTQKSILKILNGELEMKTKHSFTYENGCIVMDGEYTIIMIRGWGNLTGIGAHNLAEDEAANIQDTFAAWIIEKLTKTE